MTRCACIDNFAVDWGQRIEQLAINNQWCDCTTWFAASEMPVFFMAFSRFVVRFSTNEPKTVKKALKTRRRTVGFGSLTRLFECLIFISVCVRSYHFQTGSFFPRVRTRALEWWWWIEVHNTLMRIYAVKANISFTCSLENRSFRQQHLTSR